MQMVLCKDYALPYFDDHIDGLVITFDITLAKRQRKRLIMKIGTCDCLNQQRMGFLSLMPKLEKLLM
jgi:hypothetical protein